MHITQRVSNLIQAALKTYGPSRIKRVLWNNEYSGDKWNFADNTVGDCVYAHLEKHVAKGSILDLGCGAGNTATELAFNSYSNYVGVDISETCLSKARRRSKECGRGEKNRFACGDFLSFVPAQQFDVILFRESMYHIPIGKIPSTIRHYASYLKDGGVFIVRMATCKSDGTPIPRPTAMISTIKMEFDIVEDCVYTDKQSEAEVIVFRPKAPTAKERNAPAR
jgi:SAM-dependent methyltransferase